MPCISEGIEETTRLAAVGVSIMEFQRQGRWKDNAVVMCVRASREEEDTISRGSAFNAVVAEVSARAGD